MIRACLVDDEPPARARLRQLLGEAEDVLIVGEAGNAEEARELIADVRPDVVFLDIEMPQTRGTALAASLPEPRPFIVFATAYDQHAIDAFALAATDYLLKPITRARLAGTLARLRARLSTRTDLDREMSAASAAQAHLFPRVLPTLTGFDYAAVTVPAGAVGGDFYLVQRLSGGRLALALGDVSGKGVPAGLVASSVQARLETIARQDGSSATEVIEQLNRALAGTIESARFATLAYLEIDPASGAIDIVNAGHPPLLAVAPGGRQRVFSSTGPALGVLPNASFTRHVLTLGPDEALVAYSDGVSECLDNDGDEFGEERLREAIDGRLTLSAAEMCRTLVDLTREYRGGAPPADDVTVLVIKRANA
jgi:sigma-B regulation protein RsbU (phosphoserine phosphatase)